MPDKESMVHSRDGLNYMRISELPEEEREPFTKALYGQTCPIIDGLEPQDAFYQCDYDKWKRYGDKLPPHLWD